MYGSTGGTAAGVAGALAFTGANIAALIVLGVGLLFLGTGLIRMAGRRRPYRP